MNYFQEAAYAGRASNNEENINKIKVVLLDWAQKDALRKGINVSWGKKPVDWQMMVLINSILTTTAVIADKLDAEERKILGPWLNNLVKKVAKSRWKDRQDNKAYLTSYITMIWGLMINDLKAVQHSIDVVKLAINDMRPDGSFPIDTQRSGMGLKYNADSYGYLLMMASLLKDTTEQDLFFVWDESFADDGTTIHGNAGGAFTALRASRGADNASPITATETNLVDVRCNVVHALATSAQYADVAERFEADAPMSAGAVVMVGGEAEITETTSDLSDQVFGVISDSPAYAMNALAGNSESHPYVAMTGRTPVRVTGAVTKGQRLVTSSVKIPILIGRVEIGDLNFDDLINSVKNKLWPLGKNINFIPGHGPVSTFDAERASNP